MRTGSVIGDFVADCDEYMKQNNGNYWKNCGEVPEELRHYYFVRAIDLIRFRTYRECIGEDEKTFAMSSDNLNKMEKWYLDLAKKYGGKNEKG